MIAWTNCANRDEGATWEYWLPVMGYDGRPSLHCSVSGRAGGPWRVWRATLPEGHPGDLYSSKRAAFAAAERQWAGQR